MRWLLALAVTLTIVPVASSHVPKACTLLTHSQVEAALGAKLQWSEPRGTKLYSMCTFHGEPYNASAYGPPTLTLTVNTSTPKQFNQGFNRSMTGVRVRGVGDSAYAT